MRIPAFSRLLGVAWTLLVLGAGLPGSARAAAPVLNQPANMTVEARSTADQTITATDADGDALTFSLVSGPTFVRVTTINPFPPTATGNIHLAPGSSDAGTSAVTVRVTDTGGLNDSKSFTITVLRAELAPVLNQPANMTVAAGFTADQSIVATDADGDPLTFTMASGPTFMTVTTISPGNGTATGNIHLAPG